MPEYRKPRYSHAWLKTLIAMVLLIALLVAAVYFAPSAIAWMKSFGDSISTPTNKDADTGDESSLSDSGLTTDAATEPQETDAATDPAVQPTMQVIKHAEDVALGPLVLVNYEHEYAFPDMEDLVTLYGNKEYFLVSSTEHQLRSEALEALNALMTAFHDATGKYYYNVVSAFRDYESQTTVFSNYLNKHGLEEANKYVAQAGYSEHHTGYAIDLTAVIDGATYNVNETDGKDWLLSHINAYGWILRYSDAKRDITKIYEENWHFRYVGVPHAAYMNEHDLCLEEYITLLHGCTVDHLQYTDAGGTSWEIWYVPAATEGDTVIDIPLDADGNPPYYTISGTNEGGFVVAAHAA